MSTARLEIPYYVGHGNQSPFRVCIECKLNCFSNFVFHDKFDLPLSAYDHFCACLFLILKLASCPFQNISFKF